MRIRTFCLSAAAALLLAASCGPKEPVVTYKLFYDWTTSNLPEYTQESNARVMGILADYAKDHQLVGLVTGDAHVNMHAVQGGVNYYISQGYGWVVPDLMLEGTQHAFFDYTETLCVDVVAIKPATNEVHTFRIGAGGSSYDYEFKY